MNIEILKVATGFFSVTANGQLTEYYVVNGDLGCSGYACNMYGIRKPDKSVIWIGSLAKAKKTVTHWIATRQADTKREHNIIAQ